MAEEGERELCKTRALLVYSTCCFLTDANLNFQRHDNML